MSDLFVYDLSTQKASQLTRDRYAEIEPAWSPDGKTLAFSTDRGDATDFARLTHSSLHLALIDVSTSTIRPVTTFDSAKSINPQFSPDGTDLYFVSDRSGVSDIYRVSIASGALSQVTNVATGVSGITDLAPAISVSPTTGRVVFSVFEKQGYGIYALSAENARGTSVQTGSSDAGILPPATALSTSTVVQYLADADAGLPTDGSFKVSPYRSTLALAAVGQPTVGVSASTAGTLVGGGSSLFFTDILGNKNLGVGVQANGTLKDIGGSVMYQDVGHRLIWAVDVAHSPYASAFATVRSGAQGQLVEQFTQRVFVDQAAIITHYPFSTTRRAELNVGVTRLSFNNHIDQILVSSNGQVLDQNSFDTTAAPAVNYAQAAVALVGDNSFAGFTGPITGWRYRFEAAPTFGSLQFETGLADVRKYFFAKPLTFAVRGFHFGRYGSDAESDRLSPLFLGDPMLVRGYSAESFDPAECTVSTANPNSCPEFDRLVGSRLASASAELRLPLLGTDQLGLIRTPLFPVDVSPFLDAGVAWSGGSSPTFEFETRSDKRIPVVSAGLSARANLFGYAVLEVYYAHPFQRPDKSWVFGFQLAPGW